MTLSLLAVLLAFASLEASPEPGGTIQGIVVNGSHGDEPIGDADVVLRAGQDNHLESVARIKTDASGKFVFDHVPLDPRAAYLPGADRDGVHYPGKRVRLDQRNPIQQVRIRAFDAVESPSPLAAMRHDINIAVEPQALLIHETILFANRSLGTYVGERVADEPPVTLRLSIPANFDRVTFGSEFHGRRFRIVDHQVVTDIPWPPGERELSFTYRIPLEGSGGLFRRPLDVPCSKVIVRVRGNDSEQTSCSLPFVQCTGDETVFASKDEQLRAGYTIEVQMGVAPFPWMQCARWGALILLLALVMVSLVARRFRDGPPLIKHGQAGRRYRHVPRRAA